MRISYDKPVRLHSSVYRVFFESNQDIDLLSFDFLDTEACNKLDWSSLDSREDSRQTLMTFQRLLKLCPNTHVAEQLMERGFHCAQQIVTIPECHFVTQNEDLFGSTKLAKKTYQKAQTIRGQVTHLWANLHSNLRSPHARAIRTLALPKGLDEYFTSLPTYEDLFGPQDFCKCDHCKSIFGPAAYFVDLMRIIQQYITEINGPNVPAGWLLKDRREGLFELPLTCANTNDLVPYLLIVNEVLGDRAKLELDCADIYPELATQKYPFNLPYNDPLSEIRGYLGTVETSLPEFYETFGAAHPVYKAPDKDIAAAELGLSVEQYALVTTPVLAEEDQKQLFGLVEEPLSDLQHEDFFLLQTNMEHAELELLLLDNLSEAEIKAGLAHGFLINQPLPTTDYVHVVLNGDDARKIENLTDKTRDRINRFVRLSKWTNIAFSDLDWTLTSLGQADIDEKAIKELAQAEQVRTRFQLLPDMVAAFWADMKTIGAGDERYPLDLFDRVYNAPSILKGEKPYHPLYAQNPLYQDKVEEWVVGNTDVQEGAFGLARLMAALEINSDELSALGYDLFGKGQTVPLDVANLSLMYRSVLLLKALKLSLSHFNSLLALLGIDRNTAFKPGRLVQLYDTVVWLGEHSLSVPELAYMINGDYEKGITPAAVDYDFIKVVWTLAEKKLLQANSFTSDTITQERSQKAFKLISEQNAPKLVKAVGDAYQQVLQTTTPSDSALVLGLVKKPELGFLKDEGFNDTEIGTIQGVINKVWLDQLELLNTQFSPFLDINSDTFSGLVDYFEKSSVAVSAVIETLLTPVKECTAAGRKTNGACKEQNPQWLDIVEQVKGMSRAAYVAQQLELDSAFLNAIATTPSAYGLQNQLQLTLESIVAFKNVPVLVEEFEDTEGQFLTYFAMPSDESCADGAKSKRLSELTGWPRKQICQIVTLKKAGPTLYDTVSGVMQLKRAFSLLNRTAMDASFAGSIVALKGLPGTKANWPVYRQVVSALGPIVSAQLGTGWDAANKKVVGQLNEARRNALEWLVLWKMRQRFPTFTTSRQLYEYLLIDVDMSSCSEISRIVEGLNAIQLYLQRSRLSLEPGIEDMAIPEVWWEWMMNYRVWEANRKIFLYPENYLVPSIRKSRTDLFKSLQESLQQSEVNGELVDNAFLKYVEDFTSLTTLTYVDAYQGVVDNGQQEPVDTSFLFARTREEPYAYYYNVREEAAAWGEWRKIDLAIPSRYITPVYAFNRLFIFWAELTPTLSSEIVTEGSKGTRSENRSIYKAIIRYSFYNISGSWSAPQKLGAEQTVYVDPASTPFDDASGYQLFKTENMYWHKVNAIRITGDNLTGAPEGTAANEKIVVLYGPFINNNISATSLGNVTPPDPKMETSNLPKYLFEQNVYQRTVDVNQAVRGRTRGSISMTDAVVLNNDLNDDFIMRSTEFLLLATNGAAGIPPVIKPKLDVGLATLNVDTTVDALRANYYGDYTSDISTARQPKVVDKSAFQAPGITEPASKQVFTDLQFHNIINAGGEVAESFSLNTNLSFLFAGASLREKATLIPVVQEILLVDANKGVAVKETSFILPEINAVASEGVLSDLEANGIIEIGYVEQSFTSKSNLDFLFAGAPAEQKALLISIVRRFLFELMGDPSLLLNTARGIAGTIMVKNQPNEFILNNGDEAFLVTPTIPTLPAIDKQTRISDISTEPKVFKYSFVASNIDLVTSTQAYDELKTAGIIEEGDTLSRDFGPLTDLNFLFPSTKEEKRLLQIAQVRAVLLNLPSITALRYYSETEDLFITATSFISLGIGADASTEVFEQLKKHDIVDGNGVISKRFSAETDLSFLFKDEDPGSKKVLTEEVRRILLEYYAAVWQRNIHDVDFDFIRLTTGSAPRLSARLFSGGVNSLLALDTQQAPIVPELPFSRYIPTRRVNEPPLFDGAQVDFDGPYGLYYWELFFFAPQLLATTLLAERRFAEALAWYQYIFNPTLHEAPLSYISFMTPDINKDQAKEAYASLKEEKIITNTDEVSPEFDQDTYLGFLWPSIDPSSLKDLMIREVRNILLNHQLSCPSAMYWQFKPFRNYKLQDLGEILTNKAQIRVYNNEPFDPYAIARLRIGAFEKATLMGYIDTLLDWGDSMFTQYTWEGLTAALMLYDYAYNLLGERPIDVGACPSQPPASFQEILNKYKDRPGGIPEFLIYLENFLPPGDIIAPELDGKPFTQVDPYFCVPENSQLLSYWDKIEDRLYKIRHCLDLEGKPLVLPLFAPPIDPLALVRAAASGQSSASVVKQQLPSIPPYKFTTMVNHARSLISTVQILGDSLQTALTSRDMEALSRLQNTHELVILNQTTRVREQQIESAQAALDRMKLSKKTIQVDHDFYQGLLNDGWLPGEIAELVSAILGTAFSATAGVFDTASALAHLVIDAGSPFAMKWGGTQVGANLSKTAAVFTLLGHAAELSAKISGTVAGYQRRSQDWQFQVDKAKVELKAVEFDIDGAKVALQMAERELEIHKTSIAQTKEIQDFLKSKFDTQELYSWMANRVSSLYYQAYKVALEATLAAQSTYQYELNRDDNFVTFDYWDSLHHGLLAGHGLESVVNQMENAYLNNNIRRLEIKKTIALSQLSPLELYRLQTDGICTIELGEALFDLDFPGHYCRQVRALELRLLDTEGNIIPDGNVELIQVRNDLVLSADKAAVEYLLKPDGDAPLSIRQNWQSRQQIALSNDGNPGGTFDEYVNLYDERYLPFEGTGAVSSWRLDVSKQSNAFDVGTIADVTMVVYYSALKGSKTFTEEVKKLMRKEAFASGLYLDLANTFAGDWETFMACDAGSKTQTLSFPIVAGDFPANLSGRTLMATDLQLVVPRNITLSKDADYITLTVVSEAAKSVVLNDRVSSVDMGGLPEDKFFGQWQLTVNLEKLKTYPEAEYLIGSDGCLNAAAFQNIYLFLSYHSSVFSNT